MHVTNDDRLKKLIVVGDRLLIKLAKPDEKLLTKRTFPDKVEYKIEGSGVASSGKLGLIYGNTISNGITDYYLRIRIKDKKG
ncbi:MAG: hypothetical protein ACRDEB_02830 [Chitinophagaceae bacterium]